MVRGYQRIQSLVFPLDPAQLPARSWYQLRLPLDWIAAIKALARTGSSRPQVGVRHRSLDATLKATLPELIHLNGDVWGRYPDQAWLLADKCIDPGKLTAIMRSWLEAEYQRSPALPGVITQLTAANLEWEPITIQLGDSGPNGTDHHLVPHLVAHELCQDGIVTQLPTTAVEWHRVAAPARGAEVISWPPLEFREGSGRTWYYSYLLTLTLQTIPEDFHGELHIDVGIRRWATRRSQDGRVELPRNGDRTSVYLRAPESWLTDGERRSFCVAPVGWLPPVDGQFVNMGWKDKVPAVLERAHHQGLPSFMEIAGEPGRYLLSGEATAAAIVFGHWRGQKHGVTTGASPADRMHIFSQVCLALPWLKRSPELIKIPSQRVRKAVVTGEERSAALHAALGPEVRVEIWYQQEHVLPRLKMSLQEQLGADLENNCFHTAYGKIDLDVHILPDRLTAELSGNFSDEIGADALKRAAEIRDYVQGQAVNSAGAVLALVQIADQRWKKRDAKAAIRNGFAQAGRLSQCFFGLDSDAKENALAAKYANTILDLLRQTGRLPAALNADAMPPETTLLGLWLVKRNNSNRFGAACYPVAVRARLGSPVIEAALFGSGEWLPYPAALLKLAREGERIVSGPDAVSWMRTIVGAAVAGSPTLLMVEAHNARTTWRWLGNPRLKSDRLCWDFACEGPVSRPEQYPGLRVVRLRTNDQSETPQWYATDGERAGRTHGLFEISERRVQSVAEKADTMRGRVGKTKPEAPSVQTVTPAMVELVFPFLQAGDRVLDWAGLVHDLRSAHNHHDDATVLPLPLHMAALMEQYLVLGVEDGE